MLKKIIVSSFVVILLFMFTGCGIVSKTRYGNGFSVHSELNIGKSQIDSAVLKKHYAKAESRRLAKEKLVVDGLQRTAVTNTKYVASPTLSVKPLYGLNESIEQPKKPKQLKKVTENVNTEKQPELNFEKKEEITEVEPHIEIAGYLFYGGIVMGLMSIVLSVIIPVLAILGVFAFFAVLAGFVLAIIGLTKLKVAEAEGKSYLGKGLAISILVVFPLLFIMFIGLIFLLFLLGF